MPDISLPEVRLKDKLPEGLRDVTVEDIQKAIPEVHLPKFELPRMDLGRESQKAAREAAKAAKGVEKATRNAQKAAAKEAAKAAKAVEQALPRRSGPNPVPIGILAMIGGLVVGWILATNPTTAPRIRGWLGDLRMRFDQWRGGMSQYGDETTTDAVAYPGSLRAPIAAEAYSDTLGETQTGVGVGPGRLPEGMGTEDPSRVGADEGYASSERF